MSEDRFDCEYDGGQYTINWNRGAVWLTAYADQTVILGHSPYGSGPGPTELSLSEIHTLEADRDAWKRKAEAAIEALRPFAAWHSANVADWDLFEGHEPLEGGAASSAKVSDLRRAASLVSDRDRAKEASDAG